MAGNPSNSSCSWEGWHGEPAEPWNSAFLTAASLSPCVPTDLQFLKGSLPSLRAPDTIWYPSRSSSSQQVRKGHRENHSRGRCVWQERADEQTWAAWEVQFDSSLFHVLFAPTHQAALSGSRQFTWLFTLKGCWIGSTNWEIECKN